MPSLTLQPMSKILSSPTTPLSPTANLLSPVVNSHIREDSYEDFQRDSFPRPRLQSLPNFSNPPPLPPHVPVIRGNGMPASFPSNDHMPHKRTETWYITCDRYSIVLGVNIRFSSRCLHGLGVSTVPQTHTPHNTHTQTHIHMHMHTYTHTHLDLNL